MISFEFIHSPLFIYTLFNGYFPNVTVEYPKVFSIVDAEKEISILGEVKALGYTLPKYEQLKLQQIVANYLNSVNIEDIDAINGE
jgi:hypothetical protein